jgi:cytidyltransferase-like protein
MGGVWVSGSFDAIGSSHVRLLQEASRLGRLHVALWSDGMVRRVSGREPHFLLNERRYLLGAIRFVSEVSTLDAPDEAGGLPPEAKASDEWVVKREEVTADKRSFCERSGIKLVALAEEDLAGFPTFETAPRGASPKKMVVTGCFDWFHSGHVRFFEEVSARGNLYVVLGSDRNVRLLKGEGHPLFPEAERRYMVGAVRFVNEALISTGSGWMDAEPEIRLIKPDGYVVNEDGDKPEKREFCRANGIEYIVLTRIPKEGLPRRTSTDLRGF